MRLTISKNTYGLEVKVRKEIFDENIYKTKRKQNSCSDIFSRQNKV